MYRFGAREARVWTCAVLPVLGSEPGKAGAQKLAQRIGKGSIGQAADPRTSLGKGWSLDPACRPDGPSANHRAKLGRL